MKTDVLAFIADLEAGVFETMISSALSDVAAGVIDHDGKGHVTLKFDISRIGNSNQVMIGHKISYSTPTINGKQSEESTTKTPMYVGAGGSLTLFLQGQNQMFTKLGAPNKSEE